MRQLFTFRVCCRVYRGINTSKAKVNIEFNMNTHGR